MAVKVPKTYKGMYIGDMDPAQADLILQTRELKEIPNLKHKIFNFPIDLIKRSIDECVSIRDIIKAENIDYTQYIGELRDYQTVGTAFLYMSPRSILSDGVGLGKTAEIAALINHLKEKGEISRFIMAVETSALGQTMVELIKFTGLNIIQLPSEAAKMRRVISKVDWRKVDGVVLKHSALRSDVLSSWLAQNLRPDGTCKVFSTFILDESSVVKNTDTKTFQYTQNLCDISNRVHFMNATAFETHIMDVYNQTEMCCGPNLLPKKWRIENDFCTFGKVSYWTKVGGKATKKFGRELNGYKNQAVFKEALKLVYFGRCKADVGRDLPHQYRVYEVTPTNDQMIAIAKGHRYMEVLNCPSLIDDMNVKTDRESVPKIDRLVSLIESEFADNQVMVYCFHTDAQYAIADELTKIGRKPVVLNGESTDAERWEIQQGFNDGKYDVIITNIIKSLNLHGGDVCIFYSNNLTPSKIFQTAGRIDRNTDDRTKMFVMLLYKGTDEYKHFVGVTSQRASDSRSLTIDAKSTVDYFIEAMNQQEDNS